MTITATSTGLAIAGPESPISTIVITDPDGNESVLNMGLVNSMGMDNIIAGTSYELELLGFGAFGGYAAFIDPDAISDAPAYKAQYTIDSIYPIAVFDGSANITPFRFKPVDPTGIDVDANGYFDFGGNDVSKVEISLGGSSIDTTGSNVVIDADDTSELKVELGALGLGSGIYSGAIKVYVGEDADPIIFAGPGLKSNLIVQYQLIG